MSLMSRLENFERMRGVTRFHAKNPAFSFQEDTRGKQEEATDALRALADRWVRPLNERLEELHQLQREVRTGGPWPPVPSSDR